MAWSVVFGEQPTAAKWNQLGENDAGFRDGTNIDDDAIVSRHLANAVVTPSNLGLAPAKDSKVDSVTTSSTSFTTMSGAGPAVTVNIGSNGLALVFIESAFASGTVDNRSVMGFSVNGATIIAANDANSIYDTRGGTGGELSKSGSGFLVSGLNTGSNTFTTEYKRGSGTGSSIFRVRSIAVLPL